MEYVYHGKKFSTEKLPKVVSAFIEELILDKERLQDALDQQVTIDEKTNILVDCFYSELRQKYLPNNSSIRFATGATQWDYIDVAWKSPDGVYVTSPRAILISPIASNSVIARTNNEPF